MNKTLALLLALVMQGCVYAKVGMPLDTDLHETNLGAKVGRASSHSVLWLVAWGDSSSAKAAENGQISVLNHMDQEAEFVLFGLYARNTTIVYGD